MEPLLHWIIPTALILAFFPKIDRRWVLILSPLTFISDFDKFIPGFHRVLFYNIFFIAIVFFLLYKFLGKEKTFIGMYFLLSHYLFDLSYPGFAFLWPLVHRLFYLDFNIAYDSFWIFDFKVGSIPLDKEIITTSSNFMYTTGFLVLLLVLISWLIYRKNKK